MFLLIRSLKVGAGQNRAAYQWAKEISDYINENFSGYNVRAHREWFGANGSIYWIAEYKSVADFEQITNTLEADEGYMNMVADAYGRGLFVAGSLHDKMVQQL